MQSRRLNSVYEITVQKQRAAFYRAQKLSYWRDKISGPWISHTNILSSRIEYTIHRIKYTGDKIYRSERGVVAGLREELGLTTGYTAVSFRFKPYFFTSSSFQNG